MVPDFSVSVVPGFPDNLVQNEVTRVVFFPSHLSFAFRSSTS